MVEEMVGVKLNKVRVSLFGGRVRLYSCSAGFMLSWACVEKSTLDYTSQYDTVGMIAHPHSFKELIKVTSKTNACVIKLYQVPQQGV